MTEGFVFPELRPDGFVIGERTDLTNEQYHAGAGISSSGLKKALVSPLHYHDYYHLGGRDEGDGERSTALVEGSLFHSLTLEPDKVRDEYLIHDDLPDGRTKEGKAAREELRAKGEGKTLVSRSSFERITQMAKRARQHKIIDNLLTGGIAEHSIYWVDQTTGLLCKARPDYLIKDKRVIVDLKSTINAGDEDCSKHIFAFNYHVSAAWYLMGATAVYGEPYADFILAFQEKTRPFAINPFLVDQDTITLGMRLCQKGLKAIHAGIQSDFWPGYSNKIRPISLPRYAKASILKTLDR
jgi:hypothetical protein